MSIDIPVLLIAFNRPDKVALMLKELKKAAPSKLYVAVDAPRKDSDKDAEQCRKTLELIEKGINWNCKLEKLIQKSNLGCKYGPVTAINWFFEHEEAGIILEDDCLPDSTFFRFCKEMLERYRDNKEIGVINGENHLGDLKHTIKNSYYFSEVNHCWGWATWRRAWEKFDPDIQSWPEIKSSGGLKSYLSDSRAVKYWHEEFDKIYGKADVDIWDYQWNYACIVNKFLTVVPGENLIKNIGFDEDATHTKDHDLIGGVEAGALSFPLKHPTEIAVNTEYDKIVQRKLFYYPSVLRRFYWKIKELFRK